MRQDYKQRIEELKTANANLESERQELERADQEVDVSIKSIYDSEESSRLVNINKFFLCTFRLIIKT